MKRSVVFGVLMFSLGLAIAPRPTVAQKDETLAVLCHRFDVHVVPVRDRNLRMDRALRADGETGFTPPEAVAASLDAVRKMVCVSR